MKPVLVKWPSRGRPHLVAERLSLWNARPDDVQILVSLDVDDPKLPAYRDVLYGRPNVLVVEGTSTGKVNAINRDMDRADSLYADHGGRWEFMCLASDDFIPQREDYASHLRNALFDKFPDGDGVVQFPDGRRNDPLNTFPALGRAYFDRWGWIYNPVYRSTHCDDEMTEVSHRLGRVVMLDEVVCRHDWVGEHCPDETHRQNESHFRRDAHVFAQRQAWGFPD